MDRPLHAETDARAVIDSRQLPWASAGAPGVSVKLLERRCEQVERSSALYRLEAGARLDEGRSPAGEELLVIEGAIAIGGRRLGAGGYVLVPENEPLALTAAEDAVLLRKRNQYAGSGRLAAAIDAGGAPWVPGLSPGLSHKPLYSQPGFPERTAIVRWAPGAAVGGHDHPGGEEFFVLEGVFADEHGEYPAGTWVRSPDRSVHRPFARDGCVIFVRTGGLAAAGPIEEDADEWTDGVLRVVLPRPFPFDYDALVARLRALDPPGFQGIKVTVENLIVELKPPADAPIDAWRTRLLGATA